MSMSELAYPTHFSFNDFAAIRPSRYSLLRWLPLSLAIHLALLLAWDLSQPSTEAILPLDAGQQAVSIQLVSSRALIKPVDVQQPFSETVLTTTQASPESISIKPITKTPATSKPLLSQNKPNVNSVNTPNTQTDSNTLINTANLTPGVYSEAKPQSEHKPDYPRMAILKNQQGKVVVKLEIDKSGNAHNIQILKSSGFSLLDKAVLAFAQAERFIPASMNNAPTQSTQQYSFLFKLI